MVLHSADYGCGLRMHIADAHAWKHALLQHKLLPDDGNAFLRFYTLWVFERLKLTDVFAQNLQDMLTTKRSRAD